MKKIFTAICLLFIIALLNACNNKQLKINESQETNEIVSVSEELETESTSADEQNTSLKTTHQYEEFLLGFWHDDVDGDFIYENSFMFYSGGSVFAKGEEWSDYDNWSIPDDQSVIIFKGKEGIVKECTLGINQAGDSNGPSIIIDGKEYRRNPLPQFTINGLPMYIGNPEPFEGYMDNEIITHSFSDSEEVWHEVFFYYPGDLRDFKIYRVEYDFDNDAYVVDKVLHELDVLTAKEAVLYNTYIGDIETNTAVSFTDVLGNPHSYIIEFDMSGSNQFFYHISEKDLIWK